MVGMKNIRKVNIRRIKDGNLVSTEDEVIVDTYLSVSLNGKHVVSFICSPGLEEEAAIGYLFSSGILTSLNQFKKASFKDYNVDITTTAAISTPTMNAAVITSACGVPEEWLKLRKGFNLPIVESDLKVNSKTVISAARKLNEISEAFRRTGGTHAAAIYRSDGELVFGTEDISRHVALDKVIGKALLEKTVLTETFLVSTGRLASDMVVKAVYARIAIVASIAAPLSSGIQLAEATGVTLVGFVRGERMNIYSHPERIIP
jgi:FdhD protein